MTLNAEEFIGKALEALARQTLPPTEIIVVDSESDDNTLKIVKSRPEVRILTVKRDEFNHGGSRDFAFRQATGDFVLFFTQDAEIGSNTYIENILRGFEDEDVAMIYGRQVAKKKAYLYERFIREFNYPDKRIVRTKGDIETLGIKAFFMSNVCSAYRRTAYFALGGFESPLVTNEDMLIASLAIRQGYKTVYEPSAYVYHFHNYSCSQEFKRNFDVAAFMEMHKEEFEGVNVTGEGFRLVKYVSAKLLKRLHFIWLLRFGFICFAKYAGYRMGQKVDSLPLEKILKYTSFPVYWKKHPDALIQRKKEAGGELQP